MVSDSRRGAISRMITCVAEERLEFSLQAAMGKHKLKLEL